MYCIFPSQAGETILALVYVNSLLERAGKGEPGHIKRRFYTAKWTGLWFGFVRLREGLGVFLGC